MSSTSVSWRTGPPQLGQCVRSVRDTCMLPSASLGGQVALYEPVHGTAPDIAGKGVANPIASILSAAMLLKYSLDLGAHADRVDAAVLRVLEQGYRTGDIAGSGDKVVGTQEMGDLVVKELEATA